MAMLQRESRKGDFILATVVAQSKDGWIATALQTKAASVETTEEGMRAAIENHAHNVLGTFRELRQALRACETYAKEWAHAKCASSAAIEGKCDCGEIT